MASLIKMVYGYLKSLDSKIYFHMRYAYLSHLVMFSILFKDKVKVSKTSQERVNHKANETRSKRLNNKRLLKYS